MMRTLTGLKNSIWIFIVLSITALFLSGCPTGTETGSESGSTVVSDPNAPGTPPPTNPPSTAVRNICDPFQTNSPQARDRGLVGNLLYLTDDQPRYDNITDIINNAVIVPATIYLDRLYTPTRPFDRGFSTQDGSLIKTIDGNTLYEYFALHMESQLQLAANENPGFYQLAVLADDGALLKVPDGNGGYKVIVDNDGTHPTRMGCATEPIYLDHNTKIPMILDYYQGPRYHIALVAMWRPWPDGVSDTNPVNDDYCGQMGNDLFFDSTQDPVASQPAFYELLARNWKVLENDNYYFPAQAQNPCVPAEAPLSITNFSISGITRTSVVLTWTTNIPATSQGNSKNITTNVSTLTAVDSNLVQSHSLTITGLAPNTLYSVQALSGSAGGQKAASDERAFRTPR
ncbi:MAG: fibronectin type III domain-containing protein [Pseudobdellovibrio sp.]